MLLFSIILPTYNRALFLPKAIDSLFNQTYTNWELIVVDDASTDHTPAVLSQYTDTRIRVFRNETNQERSVSRNIGIEMAKGDYICFLDSDDYFLPEHLSTMSAFIAEHSFAVGLFHSGVKQFDEVKKVTRVIERSLQPNKVEEVLASHIPILSVAIHKDILEKFKFNPQLRINEDVHLFARIASSYPLYYTPQLSVIWVLHGSNTADQERDYLTPELYATRIIFKDPKIAGQISKTFKQKKYYELYSRLVYFHASNRKPILSIYYLGRSLLVFPFHKNNVTNLLNVIYHLPGGSWVKKTMQLFNH